MVQIFWPILMCDIKKVISMLFSLKNWDKQLSSKYLVKIVPNYLVTSLSTNWYYY